MNNIDVDKNNILLTINTTNGYILIGVLFTPYLTCYFLYNHFIIIIIIVIIISFFFEFYILDNISPQVAINH